MDHQNLMSKLDKLLVGKPSASYFRVILAKVESNDHKIVKEKAKGSSIILQGHLLNIANVGGISA